MSNRRERGGVDGKRNTTAANSKIGVREKNKRFIKLDGYKRLVVRRERSETNGTRCEI